MKANGATKSDSYEIMKCNITPRDVSKMYFKKTGFYISDASAKTP